MATGAADMMFQCVFEGSLSMCDMDIERRPYHHNCKCALHKVKAKMLACRFSTEKCFIPEKRI